jgi:SOS response regulatory protein OraA/RecX
VPTITRLARTTDTRVRVEVDDAPWRTLPTPLVDGLGFTIGTELTRPLLRTLRRQLRRHEAASNAERILASSDTSTARLDAALERSGVAPRDRESLVDTLASSGLLCDARSSQARATALANRGYGNLAIELKLETEGYESADRQAAIASLDSERTRAERVLKGKKVDPVKAARLLARRGFEEEICESLAGIHRADV